VWRKYPQGGFSEDDSVALLPHMANVVAGIVVLALLAGLGLAPSAEGTFPGRDGRITFVRTSQVYVMKPNGSDVRRVTRDDVGKRDSSPAFSPDGRTIVFHSGSGGLSTVHANGRNLRAVTGESAREPAFAPSGKQVAFAGAGKIRSISLDGGKSIQLSDGEGVDVSPTYSPRANRIAFVRQLHPPRLSQIWVMRRDGTHERPLPGKDGYDHAEPSYSPDGRRIAFIRYGQVWVMHADGTRKEKLTRFDLEPFVELSSPVFSPNGRRIAFVGPGPRSHKQVWVMKANGTRLHAVTDNPNHNIRTIDWGPGR
jgi:Tol biopolymer transport system component